MSWNTFIYSCIRIFELDLRVTVSARAVDGTAQEVSYTVDYYFRMVWKDFIEVALGDYFFEFIHFYVHSISQQ